VAVEQAQEDLLGLQRQQRGSRLGHQQQRLRPTGTSVIQLTFLGRTWGRIRNTYFLCNLGMAQ
jgi:hypothetical protein